MVALRYGHRLYRLSAALALVTLLHAASPLSGQSPLGGELPESVAQEMERLDAAGRLVYKEALRAVERAEWTQAQTLFTMVVSRSPGFPHARRILAQILRAQSRYAEAEVYAREALALERSVENLSVLILCLLGDGEDALQGQERLEAVTLARDLLELSGQAPDMLKVVCGAAALSDNSPLLAQAAERLEQIDPDTVETQYWVWLTRISQGEHGDALRALERARALGLDAQMYADLRASTYRSRPFVARLAPVAALVAITWAATVALLLSVGLYLSRLAKRAAAATGSGATRLTRLVRGAYRVVLALCCGLYYASLPLLLVVVLLSGVGALYALSLLGILPVQLLAFVCVGVLVTLGAVIRSIVAGGAEGAPGERLDLGAHPRLRDALADVASRIGTRPVDSVYITPNTAVGVFERGPMIRQLRGRAERVLVLGLGVLEGLDEGALKAILAHEYGHFSNRDTAGGALALVVRRSMVTLVTRLSQGGVASRLNPAWWFVRGAWYLFHLVSQGASRLQEVLADRWAATAYGSRSFERGLRHVVERTIRFEARARMVIGEVADLESPPRNFYRFRPREEPDEDQIAQALERALNAVPTAYDSHPSPAERIRLAAGAPEAPLDGQERPAPAWDLLANREDLEVQMSEVIWASSRLSTAG